MREPIITLDVVEQTCGPINEPEMESLDSLLESGHCGLDSIAEIRMGSPERDVEQLEQRLGYPLALESLYNQPHTGL